MRAVLGVGVDAAKLPAPEQHELYDLARRIYRREGSPETAAAPESERNRESAKAEAFVRKGDSVLFNDKLLEHNKDLLAEWAPATKLRSRVVLGSPYNHREVVRTAGLLL